MDHARDAHYFDPDGSKKLTGLYVIVVAEAALLLKEYADWMKLGARFLMVLGQDTSGKPAEKLTVDQRQSRFHLDFDVGEGRDGISDLLRRRPAHDEEHEGAPGRRVGRSISRARGVVRRNGG